MHAVTSLKLVQLHLVTVEPVALTGMASGPREGVGRTGMAARGCGELDASIDEEGGDMMVALTLCVSRPVSYEKEKHTNHFKYFPNPLDTAYTIVRRRYCISSSNLIFWLSLFIKIFLFR
eukprot:GHVT01081190.1.p1 GENE.GHVT01081190.1~~GHVT01081190.1.p1  ORF type:complete len:120 (+),score=10.32 GHVT01081190.1:411-770(+)